MLIVNSCDAGSFYTIFLQVHFIFWKSYFVLVSPSPNDETQDKIEHTHEEHKNRQAKSEDYIIPIVILLDKTFDDEEEHKNEIDHMLEWLQEKR